MTEDDLEEMRSMRRWKIKDHSQAEHAAGYRAYKGKIR